MINTRNDNHLTRFEIFEAQIDLLFTHVGGRPLLYTYLRLMGYTIAEISLMAEQSSHIIHSHLAHAKKALRSTKRGTQ